MISARSVLAIFFAAPLVLSTGSGAAKALGPDCARAGREAEARAGLPEGLLLAIGKVESGRRDPTTGRFLPWPWTVNVAGQGTAYETKQAAIKAVAQARDRGESNIDVGCFQVNLRHHPGAFANLDEAFDPDTNARYAAGFLQALYERRGGWRLALESYHSGNPARAIPYGRAVMELWGEVGRAAIVTQPIDRHGIRVWTPSAAGAAPGVVRIETPTGSR
jgi:soluble lytic murein transglycosylase-like protein